MEPDDHQCNPLIRARGTRKATVVIGAIVTFITVAYTTTRAATYGLALGSQGNPHGNGYSQVGAEDYDDGAGHSNDDAPEIALSKVLAKEDGSDDAVGYQSKDT